MFAGFESHPQWLSPLGGRSSLMLPHRQEDAYCGDKIPLGPSDELT